jgi:YVTN family beta-propeller protein
MPCQPANNFKQYWKMKRFVNAFVAIGLVLMVFSCTKDQTEKVTGRYIHGIFITNEGPFQTGTGTVSFFDLDSNKVSQDIFSSVNGKPLGNVVQSMSLMNGKGYIIVNNAAKVEVVDASTFQSETVITGVSLPRYILGINAKKAYVSDWTGVVNIVDLETNTVKGSITAGTGPENMLKAGKYVYVLNVGGFSIDSTVTVIDFATDEVVKTIQVFNRPTGIVEDATGKIWVMCSGKGFNNWPMDDDTRGHLIRINPGSLTVDLDISFEDSSVHPEKLVTNAAKNQLYFLYNNGICKYSTSLASGSPVRVVNHSNLYALAFDKANDMLLASDPVDYQQNGWVIRFRADNGASIDSIQAGIIPGNIIFTN